MKNYSTSKFLGTVLILVTIFLTTGNNTASAQAGFGATSFLAGTSQSLTVCQGSGATNIDSMLTIYDIGPGAYDTWWVFAAPAHGSLSISTATSASSGGYGGVIYTSGWTYLPTAGYVGLDSFSIYVNNVTDTAATKIYVTITPPGVAGTISGPTSVCAGGTVALSDTPSGGTWMASGTASSVSGTGIVTGLSAGSNTIMYIINNTCGVDTAFMTMSVIATPTTPIVTLSGSASFCVGGSCTLSTTAVSGITYQWWDGTSPITGATNTSYTATTSGSYQVIATNSSGCSSASVVSTITSNPLPTNTITAGGSTTFCTGGSVTLSASTGSGYTYQWSNSGSAISGATNSTYVATTGGSYSVLITDGTTGCSDNTASPVTVTVNPLPSPAVTPSGPLSFCPGSGVVFTATTGSGYSWQWYNGSTPISGATDAAYTASAGGTYHVTLSNSYSCPATSSSYTVTLYTTPTVSVTPSGSASICYGDTAFLSATVGTGYTYQWYIGYTAISGATNPAYATTTPGTYKVEVANTSGCTNASGSTTITYGGPSASITAAGSTVFCSSSVVLNANIGVGYTYQWYNGTAPIAGATTSSYTASATGAYKVRIGNSSGCGSLSSAIGVTNLGTPFIIAPADTIFCEGGSALLVINTATTGTSVFQWKRNTTNITGATNSSYTATTSGVYTCYQNVGGTCIATTPGIDITVRSAPVPVVSYAAGSFTTTTAFSSYQWKLNGVVIAGATTRTITSLGNGSYNVVVTDANNCEGTSTVYVLSGTTGVNNINEANIRLYPNPATNVLHLECPVAAKLIISTVDGKMALQFNDVKDADISSLPAGIYVVSVYDNEGNRLHLEKLVKQ